ncbi:MAG TPA: hypothetical protein VGK27_02005 [Candidatus Deferrimicrobiaceae bacterium]|jgi:hypothetical protein
MAGKSLKFLNSLAVKPGRALLLVMLWPFVFFAPHFLPIDPDRMFLRLGNDFDVLYYNYKVYLLDFLSRGHLPLWSPAEGAGFPFLASPFTQSLYPFNLPLALFYRAMGGYSAWDHHVYTIAGVAIFAVGLLLWLRLFPLSPRAVLFSALLVPVSFRMSEILRFPNAVHTAAWYPWILYAVTRIFLSRTRRAMIRPSLVLAFAMICFITAGYLYYVYYAIFLFIPYMLLLWLPKLRKAFLPAACPPCRASAAATVVAVVLPVLLLSPYLRQVARMLVQTTDRGGNSYQYSTAHVFFLPDTLGSLVFPPLAQTEGWYFFGITGVLIILLFLSMPGKRPIKFALLSWFAVITYITYGRHSLLFGVLWGYFPGFSSLRVWGRMNIILLPGIALLLGFALTALEGLLTEPDPVARNAGCRRAMWGIGIVYALILAVQSVTCLEGWYDAYWLKYFGKVEYPEVWFILTGVLAMMALRMLFRSGARRPLTAEQLGGWFAVLLAISLLEIAYIGLTTWSFYAPRHMAAMRRELRIVDRVLPAAMTTPRTNRYNSIVLGADQSVGVVDNWYYQRYISFRKRYDVSRPATRYLLGMVDGRRLFVSRSIVQRDTDEFVADVRQLPQKIEVVSYDGDTLVVRVASPVDGFLSFIDNWDDGWVATVDDKQTPIDLLFGTFKSVPIGHGTHTVAFRYRPFGDGLTGMITGGFGALARTRAPAAGRPAPAPGGAPPG